MRQKVILDTGPLVAFLNGKDTYHDWAVEQWGRIQPPLLTCEAVVSEACFLLRRQSRGPQSVLELLRRQVLDLSFRLTDHIDTVGALMQKYDNVPMSLADACLVRMAELSDVSPVLTLDAHFKIYRKNKRQVLPLLLPSRKFPNGTLVR